MKLTKNLEKIFEKPLKKNSSKYGFKKMFDFIKWAFNQIKQYKLYFWDNSANKYYLDNELDLCVKKITHYEYSKYDDNFIAYIWSEMFPKKEYYDFYKLKEFEIILFINTLLDILFNLEVTIKKDKLPLHIILDEKYKGFNDNWDLFNEYFQTCKDILRYYSIEFNDKTLNFEFSEQKLMVENINNKKVFDFVYDYRKSNNFNEKFNIFSSFAKNYIYGLLNNRKKFKYEQSLIGSILKDFDKIKRECNGFFRHSINDSGSTDETKKWNLYSEEEKIQIMNETLSIYLFILSYLRDKGINLNKIFTSNQESNND